MMKTYRIIEGKFCEGTGSACNVEVYIAPDEAERRHLVDDLRIDEHTLASALDPDELSRLEFEPDHAAVIVNRPRNYSSADAYRFKVSSMGLFLYREQLVIVAQEELAPLVGHQFQRIMSLPDLVLKLLFRTTLHYLEHLRIMNQIANELELKIVRAMENRHLINLFALEKSLVYYQNSIHSNGVVIEKLKANAAKIGFSPENVEYLEDLFIENTQCYKQAEIYSNIFASLMDARASVVNNNLSVLIKRLTIINVVFLPLNFFAGMGGMSEFSMMTTGIPWWFAYPSFAGVMLLIALVTYSIVRRISREPRLPRRTRTPRLNRGSSAPRSDQ
jgi:magnesium transporter